VTLNKSTRYALLAALEMALAGGRPVTVGGVAARHGMPPTALAKVFQTLVRAGIAVGSRGAGGGYRLARPRSAVSVLDVVTVFEPPRTTAADAAGSQGDPGAPSADWALRRLLHEVDELVRSTYASVTLETFVRPAVSPQAPGR